MRAVPNVPIEGGPNGPTGNMKKQGTGIPALKLDGPGFPERC